MQIVPIEGNTQMLDGGAMFGNAPKTMWQNWISADAANRIPLACRSLLIKNNEGKNILFETGIGAFFEPELKKRYGVVEDEHMLLVNLEKQGLSEQDIDAVVLSHLHFDHAGGLLSAYGQGAPRLLFPKAKYYIGKDHWQRALAPHPRDRASFVPVLNQLLEASGRMVLVDKDGKSELAPFVKFRFSDGHTPGLMLSEIQLTEGPLLFASDLIPGFAWVHVPISMGYDRFPELVIDEKKAVLENLAARKGMIFFTHEANPNHAFGLIKQDQKGKFYAEEIPYKLA